MSSSSISQTHFQGKICHKAPIFASFTPSLLLILLFISGSGFCVDVPLVSEPLGFQISGFDRARVWVSPNGLFALGFLEDFADDGGGDDDGFMVGIRYNLGSESGNVPVWTVGGGIRVPENSTLLLSQNGKLVLIENPSNLIVWSSETSSDSGVEKLTLLNNGNLVLMDSANNVVWESFDNPTNMLLPGQSLRFPQTLRAPSTKSITSYYNCVIRQSTRDHFAELVLVWESNVTYWRSGISSPGAVSEVRFDLNGVLRLVDDFNVTLWSKESQDLEDQTVPLRHLRIDRDGNLRIYSWNRKLRAWRVGWQAVQDQCNVFASCGLYSVCGYNSTGPVCNCLYQDPLISAKSGSGSFGMDLGSSGCRKMADLSSCRMNTSMLPIKHTSLYAVYPPEDIELMLSEKACKEYCSNDTTCIAVTSRNDGSGVCTVKRTSFISGSSSPSIPATSYLKVCLVPQAVATRGADSHPGPPREPERSIISQEGGKGVIGGIAVVIVVTVCGFLAMELFFIGFVYRKHQRRARTKTPFGKDAQMNPHYSVIARLSYAEVEELSQNFSNQLGPSVFKGLLPNKVPVVVKILKSVTAPEKEFRITVSTLGGIHHRNLVQLKGFCFEPKHKCLIYEYISSTTLENWLSQIPPDESPETSLQKLSIATGVARALAYLHLECQRCIPHGNLKLHNVMLDENLVPKVTDYGLQSLFPDEPSSSESPSERDIYAFGILLLQILSHQPHSVSDLLDLIERVNLLHIANCSNELERMKRIALWCVQTQPFLRPSIGEVLNVLEGTLTVDIPPSPFGSRQRIQTEVESSSGEIRVEES